MRAQTKLLPAFLAAIAVMAGPAPSSAQPRTRPAPSAAPVVTPALDAVFEAFKTHPIVAISDWHGLAQEADFYATLVRDPRFAREVGNVVVEFGTASQQAVIDRYVAGEAVPYTDLRKVWSDAPGWSPFAASVGYANFYAAVRAVNLTLAPAQRIHVWLGDPPIDWASVADGGAYYWINRTRDIHAAGVITEKVLAANRKALVIYGGFHLGPAQPTTFTRTHPQPGSKEALELLLSQLTVGAPDYGAMVPEWAGMLRLMQPLFTADLKARGRVSSMRFLSGDRWGRDAYEVTFANGERLSPTIRLDPDGRLREFDDLGLAKGRLREIVERTHPGSFYVIGPYIGLATPSCSQRFEQALGSVAPPALLTGIDGSRAGDALRAPGCSVTVPGTPDFGPQIPAEERAAMIEAARLAERSAPPVDRLLYLGPGSSLVDAPEIADWRLDENFRAEILRRDALKTGREYTPRPITPSDLAVSPHYLQPAPDAAPRVLN